MSESAVRFIFKNHAFDHEVLVQFRITRRDGKAAVVTRDYHPNRYNLEIEDGFVTKVTMG